MDADVVEIPPPLHQNPSRRSKKQKQISNYSFFIWSVYDDVIDLEAEKDLVVLGETSRERSKGKAVETVHGGYGDHQIVSVYHDVIDLEAEKDLVILGETSCERSKGKAVETVHGGYGDHQVVPGMGKSGTVSGIQSSNGQPSVSRNLIIIDGQSSKPLFVEDDYLSKFSDDYMDEDEYALLQAQFDNVDLPTGIEAPPTPLLKYDIGLKETGNGTLQLNKGKAVETIHGGYGGDHQVAPGMGKSGTVSGIQSSNGQPSLSRNLIIIDGQGSKPLFVEDDYLSKYSDDYMDEDEYALLQAQFDNGDLPTGIEAPFTLLPKYDLGLKDTGNNTLQPNNSKIQGKSQHLRQFESANQGVASSSSFHSNYVGHNGSLYPLGIEFGNPWLNSYYNFGAPPEHSHGKSNVLNSAKVGQNGVSVVPPGLTTISDESENETLKKLRSFKQFDTVVDTSDHHFVNHNSSMKDNPKSWAKKIQEEWKILEKDLPDTIFVRVYESRMDLLRAVIIGAEGTPYHDGLFFFDVHFPGAYPNVPPLVHYHSGGLRLNPNLYNSGKVCLSLLNTWSGNKNEKWTPGVSTMLQVLVSIQGLILNGKPFFNEPGYASMSGSQSGEVQSLMYNENTFILSVRTMMYMIKKLPKYFEDLVVGHFYSRAHDILASCKAYMEDVQVGCFVKGGVLNIDKGGGKCSDKFKADLFDCVKLLVQEFEKIGVKDCQKFMSTLPPKPTLPKLTMKSTPSNVSMNLNQNLPYVTTNQNLPYVTVYPTLNQNQNLPYMTMNQDLPYVTMNPTPNMNQNLPYVSMNPTLPKPTIPKMTMKPTPSILTMKPAPMKCTPLKPPLSKMTMKPTSLNLNMNLNPPKPTLPKMTMKPTPPILTMKPTPPKLPLPKMTMKPTTSKLTIKPTPPNLTPLNVNLNLLKPTLPKMTMKPTPPKLTMKPTPMKRTPSKLLLPKMTMKPTPPNLTPPNLNLNPTLPKPTVPKMTMKRTPPILTMKPTPPKLPLRKMTMKSTTPKLTIKPTPNLTLPKPTLPKMTMKPTPMKRTPPKLPLPKMTMKPTPLKLTTTPPNLNMNLTLQKSTLPNLSTKPTPPKLTMKLSPPKLTPPKPTLPKLTMEPAPLKLTMKPTPPTRVPLAAESDLLRLTAS